MSCAVFGGLVALVNYYGRSVQREHDPSRQPSSREDDQQMYSLRALSSTAGIIDTDMVIL